MRARAESSVRAADGRQIENRVRRTQMDLVGPTIGISGAQRVTVDQVEESAERRHCTVQRWLQPRIDDFHRPRCKNMLD